MKANELIVRQDRVVYTLMLLVASLGLVWSFWQHRHNTAIPGMSLPAQHTASKTPASHTVPAR